MSISPRVELGGSKDDMVWLLTCTDMEIVLNFRLNAAENTHYYEKSFN